MVVRRVRLLSLGAGMTLVSVLMSVNIQAVPLPPPEDTPEEVLQTEIITEARSPVDGKPLTAAQYAQLQTELQSRPATPPLSPKLRQNVFLLRIRKLIRTVVPFLPF